MKKTIALLLVAGLLIAAVVTCPKPADHREAVLDVIHAAINEKAESSVSNDSQFLRIIGATLVNNALDIAVSSQLQHHNYILWSTTTARYGGKDHTISLGLLGHVFTFSKEDLLRELDH